MVMSPLGQDQKVSAKVPMDRFNLVRTNFNLRLEHYSSEYAD